MAVAEVTPGVCGFATRVAAVNDEATGQVTLEMETECPAVRRLYERLPTVDGHAAAFTPAPDNPVQRAAAAAHMHPSCPVPTATIKAVEVACGLALPRDVTIRIAP